MRRDSLPGCFRAVEETAGSAPTASHSSQNITPSQTQPCLVNISRQFHLSTDNRVRSEVSFWRAFCRVACRKFWTYPPTANIRVIHRREMLWAVVGPAVQNTRGGRTHRRRRLRLRSVGPRLCSGSGGSHNLQRTVIQLLTCRSISEREACYQRALPWRGRGESGGCCSGRIGRCGPYHRGIDVPETSGGLPG
jgi:hypothetical protein